MGGAILAALAVGTIAAVFLWPKAGEAAPQKAKKQPPGGPGGLISGAIGLVSDAAGTAERLYEQEPELHWRWATWQSILDTYASIRDNTPGLGGTDLPGVPTVGPFGPRPLTEAEIMRAVVYWYIGQNRSPFAAEDWLAQHPAMYRRVKFGDPQPPLIVTVDYNTWRNQRGVADAIKRGARRWHGGGLRLGWGKTHVPGGRYVGASLGTSKWTNRDELGDSWGPPDELMAQFEGGAPGAHVFPRSRAEAETLADAWGVKGRDEWEAFKRRHREFKAAWGVRL